MRINAFADVYLGCIDTFSNTSWARFGSGNIYVGIQPTARLEGNEPYVKYNLDRWVSEGQSIKYGPINSGSATTPRNLIADRMLIIGSAISTDLLTIQSGGSQWRNIIVIRPDVPRRDGNGVRSIVGQHPNFSTTATPTEEQENKDAGLAIYSSTFFNLRNDAYFANVGIFDDGSNGKSNYTGQVADNCIFHQPALGSPEVPANPMTLLDPGFDPRYLGTYWLQGLNTETPQNATYATPLDTFRIPRPDSGSNAIGTATTGLVAPLDFFGNPRLNQKDKGAVLSG
jgi:hypothetical protein